MKSFASLVPYLIAYASCAGAAWYEKDRDSGILHDLGPKLSDGANIIVKGETGFEERGKRWQAWASPDVKAIVNVQTEQDVQETIRYANAHNIPFLAKSGGHGATSALGNLKDAIEINMRALNSVAVADDGIYATVGGGIEGKEFTHALWAHGKQTVTGMCECVGLTAVVLGGGHGLLQGYHGLLSDQVLSLNIVLANASVVTASETDHSELFWGMQGAGHNFGIVTSLDYKIYDIDSHPGKDVWSYEAFTYPATPETVRAVYEVAQSQLDTQPEGVMQYALVMTNPQVSKDPIILHHVLYNGLLSSIKDHTQAYHDLEPIVLASEEGTFLDYPRWVQIEEEGLVCNAQDFMPGAGIIRFPVDMRDYNIDALVASVSQFIELTTTVPEFAGSFIMIEQYPSHGVRAVDPSKSAFPNREDRLLLAPALFYPSLNADGEPNKELNDLAIKYGLEIKQTLVDGTKKQGGSRAYVNYAYGGESLEDIYGKDKLERLRALKGEYDPENKFGFYAPIEPAKVTGEGHSEL